MGNRDGIWYATNIEIYNYAESFSRLQFAADNSFVYNPTSTVLYFETNNKTYSVNAG